MLAAPPALGRRGTAVLAAYAANELAPDGRAVLLTSLLEAHAHGSRVLVIEPIARRALPWWGDWQAAVERAGGRADEWRFPVDLPPTQLALARAAGLDPRELTARIALPCSVPRAADGRPGPQRGVPKGCDNLPPFGVGALPWPSALVPMLALDLVNTIAVAGVVLFAGYGLRRAIPVLARLNIPAPVVGGLLVAIAMTIAHSTGTQFFRFDTTLQTPLQNAFFTSIGFGASFQLLRLGGPLVLRFFLFATAVAVLQNVVGAAVAAGPRPGAAARRAGRFGHPDGRSRDRPGLRAALRAGGRPGRRDVAVAAAMAGIVCGGLIGAPLATFLIERGRVAVPNRAGASGAPSRAESRRSHARIDPATRIVESQVPEPPSGAPSGEDPEAYVLLKHLVLMLVAMWIGGFVSRALAGVGLTFPSYIGAMVVAAVSATWTTCRGCSACRSRRSTTLATSRCRSSWRSR